MTLLTTWGDGELQTHGNTEFPRDNLRVVIIGAVISVWPHTGRAMMSCDNLLTMRGHGG